MEISFQASFTGQTAPVRTLIPVQNREHLSPESQLERLSFENDTEILGLPRPCHLGSTHTFVNSTSPGTDPVQISQGMIPENTCETSRKMVEAGAPGENHSDGRETDTLSHSGENPVNGAFVQNGGNPANGAFIQNGGNPANGAMNVTNNILSSQNNEIAIYDRPGPLAQIEHRGLFPSSSTLSASDFYQHQVERLLSQETVSHSVLLKLAELVPTDHTLTKLGVHLNIPIHKVSHLYTPITHL